jgi:hypothetical protein
MLSNALVCFFAFEQSNPPRGINHKGKPLKLAKFGVPDTNKFFISDPISGGRTSKANSFVRTQQITPVFDVLQCTRLLFVFEQSNSLRTFIDPIGPPNLGLSLDPGIALLAR